MPSRGHESLRRSCAAGRCCTWPQCLLHKCVPEHKMQSKRKHKMLTCLGVVGLVGHAGVSAENLLSVDLGHEMQQGLEHKMQLLNRSYQIVVI